MNHLQFQKRMHEINVEAKDKEWENPLMMEAIRDKFKVRRVKCVKYNYNFDDDVQSIPCFEGYLHLSFDEQEVQVFIKKPVDNPKYSIRADPQKIKEKMEREKMSGFIATKEMG